MARDPTPSAILRPSGSLLGTLWVSGLFTGFNIFLDVEHIVLNSHDGRYLDRVEMALPRVASALARGENILVHCAHGIHRSGSFVVLFWH